MIKLLVYGALSVHKKEWVQGLILKDFKFFNEKAELEFVEFFNYKVNNKKIKIV